MKHQLKALQTFSGPDGNHTKDDIFTAENAERVKFLTEGGYATLNQPVAEPVVAAAPASKK